MLVGLEKKYVHDDKAYVIHEIDVCTIDEHRRGNNSTNKKLFMQK